MFVRMTPVSDELRLREAPAVAIEPRSVLPGLNVRSVWHYRDVLWLLAARDIKVRYKQTLLGGLWAILQPFSKMLVLTIIFGHLARLPSDGLPYALFAFAGLLPWQLFAQVAVQSSTSVLANEALISKVWFPRVILPLSASLPPLLDAGVSLALLLALMVWYGVVPGAALLLSPLFLLLAALSGLALGLWFSALCALYRDMRQVLTLSVDLLFFATPVLYASSLIPERWRALVGVNPVAGAVEGLRWAALGTTPPTELLAVSCGTVAVLLAGGYVFFHMVDAALAERI